MFSCPMVLRSKYTENQPHANAAYAVLLTLDQETIFALIRFTLRHLCMNVECVFSQGLQDAKMDAPFKRSAQTNNTKTGFSWKSFHPVLKKCSVWLHLQGGVPIAFSCCFSRMCFLVSCLNNRKEDLRQEVSVVCVCVLTP